ncbi:ThiF family adenylyltransferase [Arthrobacter sp. FW306-2-2C-D06B]|uniref:ThiF family adenylyltransferase n=1 Tax=Arthrobacter sp. FW306-2-2C-D06B TaxID=2879618 RepID=UPI001F0021D6|nr:ThiF family adenylyltransferase [Arthrobacter sp. FW306-2-2C-D06B]UKA58239.1 ThiF family adenylyltransferase [Arthrobacter sp. FW306-2-2C-D06B]
MKAAWDEELASHRAEFEEGLARAGFRLKESEWRGTVDRGGSTAQVTVVLPDQFPLSRPKVYPADEASVPWSWHRERDGALCLIAEEDYSDLWWINVGDFLAHVSRWFVEADRGWPNDRPDLDLDRYFESSTDSTLILYGDLDRYRNAYVRFARQANNTLVLKGLGRRKGNSYRKSFYGYIGELGELTVPPRSWEDIVALLPEGTTLESAITADCVRLLLLRYTRGEHHGVLTLDVQPNSNGGMSVQSRVSASTVLDARTLRAGPNRRVLCRKSVAIVGVGAIGSHTADLMMRAGIAKMTLVDSDVLKPGNVVRHLAGPAHVGLPKVEAVARTLKTSDGVKAIDVIPKVTRISRGEEALKLVEQHDLVIDTSADFSCTALLRAAAHAAGKQIVSGCIQNRGRTARVDILPARADQQPVPDSRGLQFNEDNVPDLYETGCASPVSPATPHIVGLAAALTSHYAVELLSEKPIALAGHVVHLGLEAPT